MSWVERTDLVIPTQRLPSPKDVGFKVLVRSCSLLFQKELRSGLIAVGLSLPIEFESDVRLVD